MIEAIKASDYEKVVQPCQDHLRLPSGTYIASLEQRFGLAGRL
jgi:DNA-binding GntR family transcriptional regulator